MNRDIYKFAGKINSNASELPMVKIGDIALRNQPLFLAPMEDITDSSFRFICKQFGADVMYTEFVSSDGLIRNARKTLEKLKIYNYERPIGIQLYGHLINAMVESARTPVRLTSYSKA